MSLQSVLSLFDRMWAQYVEITPSAHAIHALLAGNGSIVNDHVAYRTFDHPRVSLRSIGQLLTGLGFQEAGEYRFRQKKLYANHFQHPDSNVPKVFVSELLLSECSERLRDIVEGMIERVPDDWGRDVSSLVVGTPWTVTQDDYNYLANESEYAGWLAAFGYRANHFTVSVNHLAHYDSLREVVELLKSQQFQLNESGGVIKGSPQVYLEQASTMADVTTVHLVDADITVPGCFYEFAYRYPLPSGELYQGFVEASADKIFESTDQHSPNPDTS